MKFKSVKKSNLVFSDRAEITLGEDRKFSGVAYSGKVIKNHPFWGNLAFDVSTMKSKGKIPILQNHSLDKVVGSGSLSFSDKVVVNGEISAVTQYGRESYDLIKDEGFPMQESVYIEPAQIITLKQGEKMTVNGHEIEGAGTVFVGGVIKEVSLTPLGADSETSTTIFNNSETINIEEISNMEKTPEMEKFEQLFSDNPEEAFKFACSCQEKASEKDDKKDDEKLTKLQEENESLKAELKKLKEKLSEKANADRTDRLQKVFSTLGLTLAESILDDYLKASDDKFSEIISSLEADAQKFADAKEKRNKELTTYTDVTKTQTEPEEDQEQKIFALARDLRKDRPMSVAQSREEARKQLKIQ